MVLKVHLLKLAQQEVLTLVSNVGKVLARAVFLFCVCLVVVAHAGDDWQPILPEELKMTAEPLAPGAPAIYLYRQVDRDDKVGHEENYVRIKILTEEGRKQADLEIPFVKDLTKIRGIKARTLRPDGTIADFVGKSTKRRSSSPEGSDFLCKPLAFQMCRSEASSNTGTRKNGMRGSSTIRVGRLAKSCSPNAPHSA